MNNVMPLTYVANIYYTLHYCWYILLLMVHTANINYSLVIIHILLNHCPGITWLCTLALPLSLQLFKFPSLLLISLLPSFHLTYKQEFHECFFFCFWRDVCFMSPDLLPSHPWTSTFINTLTNTERGKLWNQRGRWLQRKSTVKLARQQRKCVKQNRRMVGAKNKSWSERW